MSGGLQGQEDRQLLLYLGQIGIELRRDRLTSRLVLNGDPANTLKVEQRLIHLGY